MRKEEGGESGEREREGRKACLDRLLLGGGGPAAAAAAARISGQV